MAGRDLLSQVEQDELVMQREDNKTVGAVTLGTKRWPKFPGGMDNEET